MKITNKIKEKGEITSQGCGEEGGGESGFMHCMACFCLVGSLIEYIKSSHFVPSAVLSCGDVNAIEWSWAGFELGRDSPRAAVAAAALQHNHSFGPASGTALLNQHC